MRYEGVGALKVPAGPEEQAVTRAAGLLLTAKIGHKSADKKLQQVGEALEIRCWDSLAAETPVATAGQWKPSQDLPTYYRKPLPQDVLEALQVAYEGARTEVLDCCVYRRRQPGKCSKRSTTRSDKRSKRFARSDSTMSRFAWRGG
jgi:ATP-dependent helicase/nuclease subunit A